ncbi:hypothetical protein Tco_0386427 [Tanacetum coccineum]
MDNSKRSTIPKQERLDLNKSQGAQRPKEVNCHTPRRGLDGIRVRRHDFIEHLKYKARSRKFNKPVSTMPDELRRTASASKAAMEAVWIRKFISGLGIVPMINEPLNMYCDNSAAVHYANEPGIQRGARHYHRRYHYVRECVELGEIRILKVHTDNNLADPFTKALSNRKLTQHARGMGLRPASSFM